MFHTALEVLRTWVTHSAGFVRLGSSPGGGAVAGGPTSPVSASASPLPTSPSSRNANDSSDAAARLLLSSGEASTLAHVILSGLMQHATRETAAIARAPKEAATAGRAEVRFTCILVLVLILQHACNPDSARRSCHG